MDQGLSLCSWNVAALYGFLFGAHRLQCNRYQLFLRLGGSFDVLAIQEAHGCPGDLEASRLDLPHYQLFGTCLPGGRAGGTLLLLHPRLLRFSGRVESPGH